MSLFHVQLLSDYLLKSSFQQHKTTQLQLCFQQVCLCCGAWNVFKVLDLVLKQDFCKWFKKCQSTSDSACAWSTRLVLEPTTEWCVSAVPLVQLHVLISPSPFLFCVCLSFCLLGQVHATVWWQCSHHCGTRWSGEMSCDILHGWTGYHQTSRMSSWLCSQGTV